MAQDPYKYFRPEARDLLDQFAKGILELEKSGTSTTAVQRLLRLAHTLKGAARVVKQSEIADRAHAIEDTLAPFRDCADNAKFPGYPGPAGRQAARVPSATLGPLQAPARAGSGAATERHEAPHSFLGSACGER